MEGNMIEQLLYMVLGTVFFFFAINIVRNLWNRWQNWRWKKYGGKPPEIEKDE